MTSRPTRMTATRLGSLPPGVYGDPGQVGLQLRVRAAHGGFSRTWQLRFAFAGEKSTLTLGHFPAVGLERARKLAQEYRNLADQGVDPRKAKPRKRRSDKVAGAVAAALAPGATAASIGDDHSVDFLVREWLTRDVDVRRDHDKASGGEHYRGIMRREVLPAWSGRDARSITEEECFALCDEIVARGSNVQANHTARALRKLFKFGKRRRIVDDNPATEIGNPGGTPKRRKRNLVANPAELRALVRVPQAAFRTTVLTHVAMILLLTGQRLQELVRSLWIWVDFDAKTWTFPDHVSKTRGHIVPLSDEAIFHFRELHKLARGSAFVVPKKSDATTHKPPRELTRSMRRCLKRLAKLGIDPFTLHDLRRTCRTGLAMLGVPPHVARAVTNHKKETETDETYDQWQYLPQKREALNLWATYLVEQREQALRDAPLVGRRTDCVTKHAPAPLLTAALRYVLAHATESHAVTFGAVYDALREAGDLPAKLTYETARKKLQRALRQLCRTGKLLATTAPRGYALPAALSKAA
jgi:integrase